MCEQAACIDPALCMLSDVDSVLPAMQQAILYSLARAPDSVCFGLHAQVMEPSLYSGCHLRIRTGIQASISRQAQYLGYHQKRHKEPSGAGAAGQCLQACERLSSAFCQGLPACQLLQCDLHKLSFCTLVPVPVCLAQSMSLCPLIILTFHLGK